MGGFLGLNIVYTYAASGEVTQLPIDVAWACTNLWSGIGILLGPFFSGLSPYLSQQDLLYPSSSSSSRPSSSSCCFSCCCCCCCCWDDRFQWKA